MEYDSQSFVWNQGCYDENIKEGPIKEFFDAVAQKVERLNSKTAEYAEMAHYELFVNSTILIPDEQIRDDEDRDALSIVPFQIAYAVSIHKAQGLEYNSVKIVITDEMEEMISHNIFYTAITRAKNNLIIYWTKKAQKYILGEMHLMYNRQDASIIAKKYNLKMYSR